MDSYLFIDTSYVVFYKYYAIYSWYKRAHEGEKLDATRVMENDVFMKKYDKMFLNLVPMLAKKYKVKTDHIIFACDCPSANIWRMKIYDNYKNRKENPNFNGKIFEHTFEVLMPQLQDAYHVKIIGHPKLEADDIIAIACRTLKYDRAVAITNDNDYIQLLKHKGVELYNLGHQALKNRIKDIENYLTLKIILGDKSDNIPSIGKKIGEKTAEKMIANPEYFAKILEKPEVREGYIKNKTLIDFDCIPTEYFEEVRKLLKDIKI